MPELTFIGSLAGALIPRTKAAPPSPVYENRGGWQRIYESFTGAWQRNVTIDRNTVMSYSAVYACMTLIAADISKLRIKLVEQDANGIWSEVTGNSAYWRVLRKPNGFQNRIQFVESWVLSKLTRGNTYALKVRDGNGIVQALYVLDPNRVKPMVADDGSVFYQLSADNMAGGELQQDVMVPASEVIHDRFNCLFHPLIGTSPIYAAGVPAVQGLAIQNGSAAFFNNRSQPGGILTAPGNIGDDTAKRLKEDWQTNFTGENAGKVAVLGDGLTYVRMAMSAEESQLIDQLKWTGTQICSVFHVPGYKVGIGDIPANTSVQSLNIEYYSQCLQSLIEAIELCLDEGLEIGAGVTLDRGKGVTAVMGTEFDVDNLLRMDSLTQMEALEKASGVMTIDEKRRKIDLKPTKGGTSVYLQQQNYSLEALAKRDASDDPFASTKKSEPAAAQQSTPADTTAANDNQTEAAAKDAMIEILKGLA